MINSICVYCGSSLGKNPIYQTTAAQVGTEIGHRKITLVYGGGSTGLMGIIADSALRHGGHVIGVIPEALARVEVKKMEIQELLVVTSMHERKAKMAEKAEAFLALPGGFGTYEELFEALTWAQLGIHQKPIVILNINNYFEPFFKIAEHGVQEGFIRPIDPRLILVAQEVPEIFVQLENYQIQDFRPKWMDRDQI